MLSTEVTGILLLLWSLVCLGTWPALLRLGGQGSTTNDGQSLACHFQRRRVRLTNVSYVYFDYAATYVFVSTVPLLLAMCFIMNSKTNNNVNEDEEDVPALWSSAPLVGAALLGGFWLALGNLSFQWATAVYGAPLTTVLCIQGSLTVLLGTLVNYWLEPEMTARPLLLVLGVVVFLGAIFLAAQAQTLYLQCERERQLEDYWESTTHESHRWTGGTGGVMEYAELENKVTLASSASHDNADDTHNTRHHHCLGILIAVLGGIAFGLYSPAFNVAVNDPIGWGSTTNDGTERIPSRDPSLIIFTANLWFSLAFGITSIVGNLVLLQFALHPERWETILWTYLTQATPWTERRVALLAGLVCAVGNLLQFQGAQHVGYATADLVQAYPLVSTVWDVLCFGQFGHVEWCGSALSFLVIGMYLSYLGGIALLVLSSFE